MPTAIEIFCCYAREDQDLMKALRKHLMPLHRRGLITIWSDTDIDAGEAWEEEIKKHLDSAHIILLLISPDFIASDYCYSTEMERAMERNAKGEAHVIPIILRPTAWKGAPFDKLQVLPTNAKPVTDGRSWLSIDEALNDITEHISPIVFDLLLPLYIDEAEQLVKQGKPAEALAIYMRALNLNADYASALYGKGATLFLLERYQESLDAYKQAIQASLDHPDARYYYGKANALRKLQRDEESLAAYDEAIRFNPHRVRSYKEKADILLKLERYSEAVAVFDQLTKIDQENAAEHYLLKGQTLEKLGRYIDAIEAYDIAIPDDSAGTWIETLCQRKGDLLLDLNRYEEAVDAYRQAISHNPRNALYYENMGKALLELKDYKEALVAYETCIQLRKGEDPPSYYDKGRALFGLQRYEEALEAYNNAIRLSADHPPARFYHDKGVALERLAQEAYEMEKQILAHRGSGSRKIGSSAIYINKLVEYSLHGTIESREGPVYSAAISPSGRALASAGASATIRLMDIHTGLSLSTLSGHLTYIWCVAYASDIMLLSGSGDRTIKVWNLPKERIVRSLTGHGYDVRSLSISPDGQTVISGCNDSSIKIWNLNTGQELDTITAHEQRVLSVVISPDGQFFASAGWDKDIFVWDLHTREILHKLSGHRGFIYRLAISRDGGLIASASADKTVKVWDSHTGNEVYTLTGHSGAVHGVDFSPDEPVLITGGGDGAMILWNVQTSQKLQMLAEPPGYIWGVNFSPDGQFIVSRHGDNTIKIWRKK